MFNDGGHYHGDVAKGVMQGQGKLSQICQHQEEGEGLNVIYEGQFEQGKRQGQGKMHIEGGTYSLESKFVEDHPEFEANLVHLKLPKNEAEEEVKVDPKAKKPDPKAA